MDDKGERRTVRILLAEDDAVSSKMMYHMLTEWGYEVLLAKDGDEAWEIMKQDDYPTLVILDWLMPGIDGVEVCRRIRQRHREPYVYIVMVTIRGETNSIVRGLETGADDYLAKPFDPAELRVRLRAGRRLLELQERLIEAREALKHRATRDLLTGLSNRSEILDLLEQEMARARRGGEPFTVLMADLDRFKSINDTYGHMAGDSVLREVAKRFSLSVRPYDKVARYGGEEFLFILPSCDAAKAMRLGERIRASIEAKPVDTPSGLIGLTLSIGVASSVDIAAATTDAIISAADAALYRAKAAGRNRVELATGDDLSSPKHTENFRDVPACEAEDDANT